MSLKPKFTSNMKNISVLDLIRFVEGVPGAYVECDADQRSAVRRPPAQGNGQRRAKWPQAWLLALKAPANRSRLVGLEFLVLHGVGRNAWNRAIAAPVNLDVYADERAYQAEAWRAAMAKMQDFYQQAAKRKGIVL